MKNVNETIETISRGDTRVTIFRRPNGTYGLAWEQFSHDPYEECWIPSSRHPESFLDSLETARKEANGRLNSNGNSN